MLVKFPFISTVINYAYFSFSPAIQASLPLKRLSEAVKDEIQKNLGSSATVHSIGDYGCGLALPNSELKFTIHQSSYSTTTTRDILRKVSLVLKTSASLSKHVKNVNEDLNRNRVDVSLGSDFADEDSIFQATCSISFNEVVDVKTTELLLSYMNVDERVKPFITLILFWANKRNLVEEENFSNLCWIVLCLNYLRTCGIIPDLQRNVEPFYVHNDAKTFNVAFNSVVPDTPREILMTFFEADAVFNDLSLAHAFQGFFSSLCQLLKKSSM